MDLQREQLSEECRAGTTSTLLCLLPKRPLCRGFIPLDVHSRQEYRGCHIPVPKPAAGEVSRCWPGSPCPGKGLEVSACSQLSSSFFLHKMETFKPTFASKVSRTSQAGLGFPAALLSCVPTLGLPCAAHCHASKESSASFLSGEHRRGFFTPSCSLCICCEWHGSIWGLLSCSHPLTRLSGAKLIFRARLSRFAQASF